MLVNLPVNLHPYAIAPYVVLLEMHMLPTTMYMCPACCLQARLARAIKANELVVEAPKS